MGMYTELFLQVELKKETPVEVIDTLKFMLGENEGWNGEPPFVADRWGWMLRCSSHSHYPFSHSHLDYAGYMGQYYLFVRCDLKNYTGEIEGFLNWISPWVNPNPLHYEGHYMYEESDEPTRIRFPYNKERTFR